MEADKLCALLQGIQSCAKDMIERLENALQNRYEIYQLRDSPETRPYFFQGTKGLKKLGLTVRRENYEKVYSSPLTPGITLDHIFQKFNINHPEDFTGHSLSISDIVVLHENGKTGAFYVDHSGFTIIPDFLKESEQNHEIRSGLSEEQSTDLSKLCLLYTSQGFVHPALQTIYFLWNILVGLVLALPSPFNVKMHVYQSFLLMIKKDRWIYKPISIQKDSEHDVIR